jgi:hypothetical protein
VDWIHVAWDRKRRWALMNTVMKFRVPNKRATVLISERRPSSQGISSGDL